MLEVRDLRVVYPNGYEALKSISLAVQDGEIVALIGRSGAALPVPEPTGRADLPGCRGHAHRSGQ